MKGRLSLLIDQLPLQFQSAMCLLVLGAATHLWVFSRLWL